MDREVLRIGMDRNYSYDFLVTFFGGEENMAGVTTPEIEVKIGSRTVILTFECDRVEIGDRTYVPRNPDSYKLVELSSYEK